MNSEPSDDNTTRKTATTYKQFPNDAKKKEKITVCTYLLYHICFIFIHVSSVFLSWSGITARRRSNKIKEGRRNNACNLIIPFPGPCAASMPLQRLDATEELRLCYGLACTGRSVHTRTYRESLAQMRITYSFPRLTDSLLAFRVAIYRRGGNGRMHLFCVRTARVEE